jgi:polar amino acid transport system substrate-binding protein
MNYLRMLPVSNLKIDKSFLDRIMDNSSDQKIVSSIISLANNLELQVIAEGVEFKEQAEFLKSANCNLAQGYLYSRPIPKDEATKLLVKYNNTDIQ